MLGLDVKNIRRAQLLQVSMKALVELDPLADAANRRRVRKLEDVV